MLFFNIQNGSLEATVQGYRNGFISNEEYHNLSQCETIEDLKSQLQLTEYGNFLANEASITSKIISNKATQKFADEFGTLRREADSHLSQFMDYISYEYMIQNVLKLIAATRNGRTGLELLCQCHPLGIFPGLEGLSSQTSVQDMFEVVLIDSPIGRYFCPSMFTGDILATGIAARDFDEFSLEFISGVLYKNYLEDFYMYCSNQGGRLAVTMCQVLEFEADKLMLLSTINTIGMHGFLAEERVKLYPSIGLLACMHEELSKVEELSQLKELIKIYPSYSELFQESSNISGGKSYGREVDRNEISRNGNLLL